MLVFAGASRIVNFLGLISLVSLDDYATFSYHACHILTETRAKELVYPYTPEKVEKYMPMCVCVQAHCHNYHCTRADVFGEQQLRKGTESALHKF